MSEASPGGLIGLASTAGKAAKGLLARTDSIAILLVLFAGVITIFKKNYTDDAWDYAMWFGIALGIAALMYEMSAAKAMARAWFNGKPGALLAALFIWLVAFGFSMNQWVGAASQSQTDKSNIHKAAFLATSDTRKAVTDAEKALARLESERSLMTPVRAQAAARAEIDKAEAHKWFIATDKCAATRGKQTRAFCDNYRAAQADLKLWDDIGVTEGKIANAQARLDDARTVASGTKVETSEARSDLIILTKYAGMSEEDAQMFNGLGAIIAISIFLSFGSMRSEWERMSAAGRRTRFNAWIALRRAWCRIMLGREPENVTIQYNGTMDGISKAALSKVLDAHGIRA